MKKIYKTILFTVFALVAVFQMSLPASAQKYNRYSDSFTYRKAIEALDDDNAADARKYFQQELTDHPENGYACLYMSHLCLRDDEYGKALDYAEKALRFVPRKDKQCRATCYFQKGSVYNALDDDENALLCYSKAISLNPDVTDYYLERADVYFSRQEYDLADADYQTIKRINPNHPHSYMGLGRNFIARKDYSSAISCFDKVISLYPDYSKAYAFRGEAKIQRGNFLDASKDVTESLAIDYDDKAFALMLELADSALVQISTCLKAKGVEDPNNPFWPYALGIVNERSEHFDDAIPFYLRANRMDEDGAFCYRISRCYEAQGEWLSAIKYIDRALMLDPSDTDYLFTKADLYFESGQVDDAISLMTTYIDKSPDYFGGYYRRGWYKDNNSDVDGAISDYTTSIILNPDYPYAYVARGNMYLLQGNTELAEDDFCSVLQKDTVAQSGSCRMYALMRLGERQKAIEWMNEMLSSSEDEGIRYEAACLYSLMGDTEKGLYFLEESLKKGNRSLHHIMTDDDIEDLRQTEEFYKLIDAYFPEEVKQKTVIASALNYVETVYEVPFKRDHGVLNVDCKVNGLPLHFVLDTGASVVSLSSLEANFMYKNNFLSKNDIIGKSGFIDANGDISIGTEINIKNVDFAGLQLKNVRASVVHSNSAPLLLGQSVLNRLGRVEIDYEKNILKITCKQLTK